MPAQFAGLTASQGTAHHGCVFSHRITSETRKNRLTLLLDEKRRWGVPLLDLTESNPTRAGLAYPAEEILTALSDPALAGYDPEPLGRASTRRAIARYYSQRTPGRLELPLEDILLTSGTSEGYAFLFKLLADPGEAILCPRPSYPLFDYLAALESVEVRFYQLFYASGWHIDMDSLAGQISSRTRALIVVHPNNPTGSFIKREELDPLVDLCGRHHMALICDEVFFDYPLQEAAPLDLAGEESPVLTFLLNGLSKLAGLPQLKLAWILMRGPQELRREAGRRLELMADTFLSVSAPAQLAAERMIEQSDRLQTRVRSRLQSNLQSLRSSLQGTAAEILEPEGGWYSVIRVPRVHSEEEWALLLLRDHNVLVHPGYFFDFSGEAFLVVSLLTAEASLQEGAHRLRSFLLAL